MDEPLVPTEVPSSIQKGRFQFSFVGEGTDLAFLMIKNFFFTIITLGIYRAWAKTNTRRYLWENVKFMDDRAKYVGTGEELFKGWIKLFGILLIIIIGSTVIQKFLPLLAGPVGLFVALGYMLIFAIATYSGLRYRLSRTLWRQIRFGVDKDTKSTKEFIQLYLKGVLLSGFTFGVYIPVFRNQVITFLTNRMRLGSGYFKYDGDEIEYLKINLIGFFLSIITLGLYVPWFLVNRLKFRLKHTTFQGARFEFTMKGIDIFLYGLGSYLAIVFTLGLAFPWVMVFMLKKIAGNIFLEGELDLSVIRQQESDGSAMADDLVAEYDLDLGF